MALYEETECIAVMPKSVELSECRFSILHRLVNLSALSSPMYRLGDLVSVASPNITMSICPSLRKSNRSRCLRSLLIIMFLPAFLRGPPVQCAREGTRHRRRFLRAALMDVSASASLHLQPTRLCSRLLPLLSHPASLPTRHLRDVAAKVNHPLLPRP